MRSWHQQRKLDSIIQTLGGESKACVAISNWNCEKEEQKAAHMQKKKKTALKLYTTWNQIMESKDSKRRLEDISFP